MQKRQDATPTIFADGPSLEHEETLRRWIEARTAAFPSALLRLPFTFFAGTTNRAALGLPRSMDEAWVHRLDDSALGISLADRLRSLREGSSARCAVWLSVRMGPLLPDVDPAELPVASVFAVHEPIDDGAPAKDLRAQAERGPDCLAVRLLGHGHCARGSLRCEACREAAARPASPALLDLCPDGVAARPTVAVERGGKKVHVPYEVLRRFASEDEAKAFAARHGLLDVRLDSREG